MRAPVLALLLLCVPAGAQSIPVDPSVSAWQQTFEPTAHRHRRTIVVRRARLAQGTVRKSAPMIPACTINETFAGQWCDRIWAVIGGQIFLPEMK